MKQIKKRGFTLVELVIVIAVIAILAAVLIPTFITVIDNANDSADTQLVRNMNSVLSTEVYADETATAENLRKLLKENGLEAEALQTKKSENIIVYNQSKNRFEKINLSKANILTEGEAKGITSTSKTGNRITAHADDGENALIIDPNPFSFAEIFEGYTIVSTGGNSLAEAVYGFSNFQFNTSSDVSTLTKDFEALWKKVLNINIDNKEIKEEVIAGLRNQVNGSVFIGDVATGKRTTLAQSLFQIDEDNTTINAAYITCAYSQQSGVIIGSSNGYVATKTTTGEWNSFSNKNRTVQYDDSKDIKLKFLPANVIFPETTTELYLMEFIDFEAAAVVIPNNIEKATPVADRVSANDYSTVNFANIMFLGNTDILTEASGGDMAKLGNPQVSSMHIQEVKKSVKEYGASVAYSEYYVVNPENSKKDELHYYTDLQTALNKAEESAKAVNLPRKVILASDYEIKSGTITIPQNVTLHVPYSITDGIKTGQGAGTKTTLVDDELKAVDGYKYADETHKQCTLTVASGASITVNGTLEVGAEMNGGLMMTGAAYYNCVNGNYGQIDNSGAITVAAGGRLNAYGYVKCRESGKVVVNDGATVYDPIVITDMTSGNTLASLVFPSDNNRMFPFMRYALPNITKLEVNYGGLLSVMNFSVAMGSGESLIDSEGYFVGSDKNPAADGSLPYGGLLTLKSGGSVDITYEYKNAVKDENPKNNLAGDIGVNKVTLHGNVRTGIVMSIASNIQNQILCWIPYNFEFEIENGCTFTVTNKYAALPGAKVTVKEGGKLTVASGGAFYVVDSYNAEGKLALDGKSYPSKSLLGAAELPTSAVFTLESGATFDVQSGAHVGGTIQATAGAKIKVAQGADLTGTFTIGADLSTDEEAPNSNKQDYTLPLKYTNNGETKGVNAGEITV